MKSNEIKLMTKKHTTWRKVFLAWLDYDDNLNIGDLRISFTTLIEYKQTLSKEVNIDYAYSLIDNEDGTSRGIIEKFNDKIQEILHQHKKDQFISSLKTQKYSHLFNDEVESTIHTILDNKVSISAMKNQFFNKLSRYKTPNELAKALSEFKSKNIIWNKEYYLNKIEQEDLNVDVLEKENTLMIEVKDYKSCKSLGSLAWCIVSDRETFDYYTKKLNRQYIYLNFDFSLENNESMIGFTVHWNGNVSNSYLKNDAATPQVIQKQFIFQKLSKIFIHRYLGHLPHQEAFLTICDSGFMDFYVDYISKSDVDPAHDYNTAIQYASQNGHTEIVKLLLADLRVYPADNNDYAIRWASENGHLDVVELLLTDNRVNPSTNNNTAIRFASRNGHIEIVKLLLADNRVNPSINNNTAIRSSSKNGHLDVVKSLLTDKRVDPSANDNYAIQHASRKGYIDVVKLLLSDNRIDPSTDDNYAIRHASRTGRTEIVKLLLADKRIDPSTDDNFAIQWASQNGDTEIVELLLADNRVDPSDDNNHAIQWASRNGHTETVKLLLTNNKVDPSDQVNGSLMWAVIGGHTEVVKLLLDDNRVDPDESHNYFVNQAAKGGYTEIVTMLEYAIKRRTYA